jgi:hypothetical protein
MLTFLDESKLKNYNREKIIINRKICQENFFEVEFFEENLGFN